MLHLFKTLPPAADCILHQLPSFLHTKMQFFPCLVYSCIPFCIFRPLCCIWYIFIQRTQETAAVLRKYLLSFEDGFFTIFSI